MGIHFVKRAWLSVFLATLATGCTNLFYYPSREHVLVPTEIGVEYEEHWIRDEGQPALHAWLLPAQGEERGVILHLHGNAENISTHFASVYWLPQHGYTVLLFDYRGYGKSEGRPRIAGIHEDIVRAARYLKKRRPGAEYRVLFGQSLGGTMALYSAAQSAEALNFDALVVESAFSSYRSMAADALRPLGIVRFAFSLFTVFVSDQYSPLEVLDQLPDIPVLLVHGSDDRIVPISHFHRLRSKLGERAEAWILEGGGHIGAFGTHEGRQRLLEFLERHRPPEGKLSI